jgi:hypothetical protein
VRPLLMRYASNSRGIVVGQQPSTHAGDDGDADGSNEIRPHRSIAGTAVAYSHVVESNSVAWAEQEWVAHWFFDHCCRVPALFCLVA